MKLQNFLGKSAKWLTAIGAINWGLVVFDFNLVEKLLGSWPNAVIATYGLVGISGLYVAYKLVVPKK
jgi:uncharacterized membrane protein YuzA (DUF378 family)